METDTLRPPEANPAADLAEEIGWVAYLYWKAEGCPEGESLRHWLQAESDVLATRRNLLKEGGDAREEDDTDS